ncbi:MAG: homoserine kinase [Pseudomonadota bacterium]|nr:homoserine kinase [Pseudomonadota bacterium]
MSVYTKITNDELELHLENYSLGKIINFSGISEGIENSNYLLNTENGDFIFTIFEAISADRVIDYLSFMNHINKKGLLSPLVIETKSGKLSKSIQDKPSAVIEKLEGKSIVQPTNNHCEQLGKILANFHLCGQDFSIGITNARGSIWAKNSLERLNGLINKNQLNLIQKSIEIQEEFLNSDLPTGMIHADLFRDNVLYSADKISGIIDFYYSCCGPYIYDLAIVVNDWCNQENNSINEEKFNHLLAEYNKYREISDIEKTLWKHALVSAALRFYLSRLTDLHYPKIGEITHIKDPSIFENILIDRIESNYQILL